RQQANGCRRDVGAKILTENGGVPVVPSTRLAAAVGQEFFSFSNAGFSSTVRLGRAHLFQCEKTPRRGLDPAECIGYPGPALRAVVLIRVRILRRQRDAFGFHEAFRKPLYEGRLCQQVRRDQCRKTVGGEIDRYWLTFTQQAVGTLTSRQKTRV